MLLINDNIRAMRKLTILKSIVDIFWILTLPAIPLIVGLIPFIFISDGFDIPININGNEIIAIDLPSKIVMTFVLLSFIFLFYNVFLFRKMLRYFQKLKIFDVYVINALNKMGVLFILSGFLSGIPTFLYRLFYLKTFKLEIGFSPFLLIVSLGLFLMVLSEVFKIAKRAKEDNELTI